MKKNLIFILLISGFVIGCEKSNDEESHLETNFIKFSINDINNTRSRTKIHTFTLNVNTLLCYFGYFNFIFEIEIIKH